MHPYSVSMKRNKIMFYLSMLAIIFASVVSTLLRYLPLAHITIPVTSLTIFLLVMRIFDQLLWKNKTLRKIGIVRTPNIIGEWQGTILSNETQQELPITVTIKQTWSKIRIECNYADDKWISYTAALQMHTVGTALNFAFEQFHLAESLPTLVNDGYAKLYINTTDGTLQGRYYCNSAIAVQDGTIHLTQK